MSQTLNRGAVALRAAGKLAELSALLDCSTRALTQWRAGLVPSLKFQARIARCIGIPRSAWYLQSDIEAAPRKELSQAEFEALRADITLVKRALERQDLSDEARLALEALQLRLMIASPRGRNALPYLREAAPTTP